MATESKLILGILAKKNIFRMRSVVYEATQLIVTEACVNQTVKNGLFFVYINKTNKTAERNCKQNKQMPRENCKQNKYNVWCDL